MRDKINYLILLFIITLMLPLVMSVPSLKTATLGTGVMEISHPEYLYRPQNIPANFYWHVSNGTTFFTNVTANCAFHLHSKEASGDTIYLNLYAPMNGLENDYTVKLDGGNFSQLGDYCYTIECNSSSQVAESIHCFEVTNSNSSYSMTGLLASTGLLFFLAILFMTSAAVFDVNRWIIKSVLLIISLLFVIMAISSSMVYILDTNNSKLMSTALIIAISTLSFVFIALFVYYLKAILGAMKDIRKERDSELL